MRRFTDCGLKRKARLKIHAQRVAGGSSEQMRHEGLFLPKHDLLVLQTSFRVKQATFVKRKHLQEIQAFLYCAA
jgi:hypothetical protein